MAIKIVRSEVLETKRVLSMAVAKMRCEIIQSLGRVRQLEAESRKGKVMLQKRDIQA
jgi:hypothetical protein